MCGRCDRDLHRDVENRCGLESGSCVGPYFCHGINSLNCRSDALQDSQVEEHGHIFTFPDQKLSCCVAGGHDVAAEARTPDNVKVCHCRRGPDQDLHSGKKKDN